jgi:hypothetical protein
VLKKRVEATNVPAFQFLEKGYTVDNEIINSKLITQNSKLKTPNS